LNLPLNRIPYFLTRRLIAVLLPWPEKAPQAITPFSGYYVYVEMRHCLANTIINCDERSFGP
jgi:hypothetical protein